jgi:choline dehydrogenase
LKCREVHYLERQHIYGADPSASPMSERERRHIKKSVRIRREVILSGGAYNTPQTLMLSGIGPKEELERHGILLRKHLPGVGRNLQDRYEISAVTRYERDLPIVSSCKFGAANDPCLKAYLKDPSRSPYSTNGVLIGIKMRSSVAPNSDPDLFVFGTPARFEGYKPGFSKAATRDPRFFTWAVLKGHTRNRSGYVRLRSKDPLTPPEIQFNYFPDSQGGKEDLQGLLEGLEFARSINRTSKKSSWIDANVGEEVFLGALHSGGEDLKTFVKREAWGHHASCSCRMGASNDPMAVVDKNFTVIGTNNVRIVDASVFPKIPGLFIALPTFLLAEKAAEIIIASTKKEV